MTATLENDTDFDWRTRSVCEAEDFDMTFVDVDDLIEQGVERDMAKDIIKQHDDAAKAVCDRCPVVAQCLNQAMEDNEEYGVWGGKNPAERNRERHIWLQIRGIPSLPADLGEVKDPDALSSNAAANAKLTRRNERARIARDLLLMQPADWTNTTRSSGTHTREQYLAVMDMILANPASTAEVIANRIGRRGEYINSMLREVCKALEVN
ncbi:WhiB family transcription factor [Mycobacterium phage Skinny]|nr:transcriptional regulator WhiB-like [Mycobacterium phage PegLeg]ALF00599.1 WhiB family transcription factor [Mycobacterium phage Bricole]AXQ52713.1 WhiB family transcription factor [Mycobacterium phage IPhane7]QDH93646.1 WhiB family transcription factor [Mycobacterium phage LilhomieP]QGJ93217.1 WhiB family transcription factor [Mycobacterium phage TyDawg]QUU29273.1 WhiB family transcription factor [Mycobacterium phage SirSheldon]UXE05271.1 WhiB family transcription factor [Mycobacterium ph